MPGRTEADIPETGAIFTCGKSSFADDVPSQFWLKSDRPVETCCGAEHSAVLTENGRLLMFGGNTGGQLGLKIKPDAKKPTSVKALKPEKVKLVACGRDHTLVCTFQHCVCGAGRNQKGQLGLGHKKNTKSFQLLRPFCESAPVKMLAAGSSTSAALTEEGRLFMWGDNSVGQIGLGDKTFAAEPRELNVGQAVMWVSCGHRHSAFVTAHGGLYTFGESANGRLGLQVGQLANHRVPQQVHGIMGSVIQVCCGREHTVALTEEAVYTFGRGQYGQLGHGTFEFELHLPKPLERFHNSSARRIACGENHTAVITNAGLLYTFGDGRYGKLGLQQENFINQFSPTLCTRFLKYSVQSVSCGGHHTLVLVVPRPAAQSQGVESQKDATITDFFWESDDPENLFKGSLMSPAPVVPLSALAARARHRKKKSFVELFGELPQTQPRPNSGFLSTSWQTSRNIPNLKQLPKDASTPTSFPKAAPTSPLLSPRSQSISSKPSSPRTQSSLSCRSKASAAISSRSKSKRLPSSVSSSTSRANHNSRSSACSEEAVRSAVCRGLNYNPSDAFPPNKPCSPNRPLIRVSDNNLDQQGPQTEGEARRRQLISQDVEDERNHVDFLPYMETRTGRVQIAKELEVHGDQKSGQSSPKYLKAEALTGSNSRKEEELSLKSRKKRAQVTSQDRQNINNSKTKPPEAKDGQSKLYSIKSTKHDKKSATTQQPVPITMTKVSKKREKNQLTELSFKKEPKMTPKGTNISSSSDKISSTLKVKEITTENISKDDAVIQNKSADLKSAEVKKQQDKKRLKSTPTKKKVERTLRNIQNTTVPLKSQKLEASEMTKPPQAEGFSVKSTPVKVIKPKPDKNQSKPAEKLSAEGKSIKKGDKDGLIYAKNTTGETEGRMSEKQNLFEKKTKKEEEPKVKQRKRGKEDCADVNSDRHSKAKPRIKTTVAPSQISSHHEDASEVSSNAVSSQSPTRTRALSGSRAKSLQSSDRPATETLAPETQRKENEDLQEGKQTWGEILSDAAFLLPAAGVAGAAVGLLSEAVTRVEAFRADSNGAASPEPETPKVRQFTKQSATMHPSFSDSEEREDSTQKDAQMSILSDLENDAHEEEFNDPSVQELAEQIRKEETFENKEGEEESAEEQDDSKMTETNTGDEEQKEDEEALGSDVGSKNEDEERESSEAAGGSEPGDDDDDEPDSESEGEESEGKTSSSVQEEGEESNKSDTKDAESEEEESSMETGEGVSHSEASEAAEEDEGGSEEQSDDESKGEDFSEASEDEEEKSGEGSEREHSESEEEEEEEEEGGEGSDTAVSEEEESEERRQSDEEQETENEESGGEGEEVSEEEEEQGELYSSDEEAEQEATEDEEEAEEENTEEENEEEEQGSTGNEEDEGMDEEIKSEEEEQSMEEDEEGKEDSISASEEEEESEDDQEDKEEASEEKEKESEEEKEIDDDEEEEAEEEEEEEEQTEKGEVEEEEEEEEEQMEEYEEEEEEAEEEEEQMEKEEEEAEEEEEEEEQTEKGEVEEEEEEEEEQMEEYEEEEDQMQKSEVEEEEEEEEDQMDEDEEEEEGEEEDEEEVQETAKKQKKREKSTGPKGAEPPSSSSPSGKRREAPRPAPRSKQRDAEEKKPEESKQFWNDVLPQYLDLQ